MFESVDSWVMSSVMVSLKLSPKVDGSGLHTKLPILGMLAGFYENHIGERG